MRPVDAAISTFPAPVEVQMGSDWVPATAHADRTTRQGPQFLVGLHGHLVWVTAHHVRPAGVRTDAPRHGGRRARRRSPA
jgi:hypothetical protein